jgi:serine/threonine-protein kinase
MTDRSSAPPEPLTSGSFLAGKYRLEREIGRGAMGTVWLATHVSLDQQVAIKVISREHAHSAELRQRFGTEARAAAKLRSRYVVGVYDHGETPDALPFIVMEYLDGECLEDRLARDGTVPVSDALRITRHVARALSRAHANGIVHRDLKPANIFIARSEDDDESGWTAKVLDFGVAKMDYGDKSATKTGTLIGTPLFMSPEQVRGASNADHRSDLYSLGMVVYNMLTGQYAFDKATFGDLLISICTDPLPRLRSAAPWVPEGLEGWFQKACARAPEDRFADAEEMLRALDAAAGFAPARRSMVDMGHSLPGMFTPTPPTSAQAATVPGTPLPETPGAGTSVAAPPSPLASSSISSAGAASVTVNLPPVRRSLVPWAVGLGVAAALGLALLWGSGAPDEGTTASSGQAVPGDELRPSVDGNAPPGSDKAGSDKAGSDKAGSDKAGSDTPAASGAVDGTSTNGFEGAPVAGTEQDGALKDGALSSPSSTTNEGPKLAPARPTTTNTVSAKTPRPASAASRATSSPAATPPPTNPTTPPVTKPAAPSSTASSPPRPAVPDLGF